MARPGTTSPDLAAEIRALQRRIESLERAPVPQTIFDQYPTSEWAAVPRQMTANNAWSSCGIANVTGLKYDRVEVKYLADRIYSGRSEAEIRLAAFRHDYDSQNKTCISATDVIRLTGTNGVIIGKWRWIHGIQFGWDYTDDDNAIYTIELQHRYPDDCHQTPDPPNGTEVLAYWKHQGATPNPNLGQYGVYWDGSEWTFAIGSEGQPATYGWVPVPNTSPPWDGSYHISNMHYCVGLSQERLPGATTAGWHWINGNSMRVRSADINEPYVRS